jgi:hypothetical protein
MKTEQEKIDLLRKGIMCAIIHLFNTDPKDVIDMFTLEELTMFADETEAFGDESLEGIFKDCLTLTE